MIFKPSETTPLCALKVAEILIEAGLPAGLYNVIQGMGEVGSALSLRSSRGQGVLLRGSVAYGAQSLCRGGLTNEACHYGSWVANRHLLFFDDADLENSVSGAILANFYSTGQVCSNGTRVFVQKGILDTFLTRAHRTFKSCRYRRSTR